MSSHTNNRDDLAFYREQAFAFIRMHDAAALTDCISNHSAVLETSGYALFFRACEEGDAPCVQVLLSRGIDVNHTDAGGLTGIDRAAKRRHWPLVSTLLDAGANPDGSPRAERSGSATPLMHAASAGHIGMMQRLQLAGAATNYRDSKGQHLVFYAAQAQTHGAETVRAALDMMHGPHLSKKHLANSKDHTGETPLHAACRARSAGAIAALMASGANPHVSNVLGQTPADLTSDRDCLHALQPATQPELFPSR